MTPLEEQTVRLLKGFFSQTGLQSRHEIDSMETALQALLEFQREVLALYYEKQCTFQGIAERMELNPVTVAGLHNRGLARLAKLLKEIGMLGKRGRPASVNEQNAAIPQRTTELSRAEVTLVLRCPACARENRAKCSAPLTRYRCACGCVFMVSRHEGGLVEVEVLHSRIQRPGAVRDFGNEDCYSILGISPSASMDDAKKAYRARLFEYHYDRVAQAGKEMRDYADEITKWMNLAYAEIKQKKAFQ
jgi:DnaJ-domain-containing protein 1